MFNDLLRLARDLMRPNRKTVVFALVANPGTTDGRVIKQATALRDAGYEVWLYCRQTDGFPAKEIVDGINVRRFECFDIDNIKITSRSHALAVFDSQRDYIRETVHQLSAAVKRKISSALVLAKAKEEMLAASGKTQKRIKVKFKGLRQKAIEAGEEVKVAKQAAFYYRYFLFAHNLLLQRFETLPDIIHAHDLMALPAAVALARKTSAKVIFDAHEIETERTPPLPPEKKKFIATLEYDLFKKTDEIVVCCDSAADFYFEIFRKRRPILVMNAPDDRYLNIKAPQGMDVRSSCGLSSSAPLIVYTGSVGMAARGVDKIVEALRYLPGYHLAIQGPRNVKFDDWLRTIVHEQGVIDRVHFLPPVSQEVLVDTLRTGDVGVCAFQDVSLNHRYALPNKVFEMAFAGLPLCLSNLVEMSKFIIQVRNGVTMDETDPESIAKAIAHVYEHQQRYRLGIEGKETLMREYSWSTQAARLRQMYNDLGRPTVFRR